MKKQDTYIELLKISIKLEAFTQSLHEEIGHLRALAELQEPELEKVKPNDEEFYGTNIYDVS